MSEVPEIETIVRDLQSAIIGRLILQAEVLVPETVRFPHPDEFAHLLAGRRILNAERRAKHILLTLEGDLLLEMHFMLWGTLRLIEAAAPRIAETLIVYRLDRNEDLRFTDQLGYARAALGSPAEVIGRLKLNTLGPEALAPDFSVEVLARQLRGRRGVLKSVLLDQHILAGLGNRDADESLWLAGIDPQRPANSLDAKELIRLHDAICRVLEEGISLRGTQPDLFGQRGKAQHRRRIFERTGEPCPHCGTAIQRLRIGGRNTHYCPQCQH